MNNTHARASTGPAGGVEPGTGRQEKAEAGGRTAARPGTAPVSWHFHMEGTYPEHHFACAGCGASLEARDGNIVMIHTLDCIQAGHTCPGENGAPTAS